MARPNRRRPMSQINVVPYIDVMLVLLVIFMVTAPLLQTGVDVDLPQASARPMTDDAELPEALVVVVDRNGQFFVEGGRRLSADELAETVRARLAKNAQMPAYVRGDRHVEYQRVVEAMVILQQAGLDKVGLITDPPPDDAR
ncbi:MAG: protein TolR [Chromatiales bacterium]|nr:protein TolR [Chromatiales bacterium]